MFNNGYNNFNASAFSAQNNNVQQGYQNASYQQPGILNATAQFIVDRNFGTRDIYNLENPEFIMKNLNSSTSGYDVYIPDNILKQTTKMLLNKMNMDMSDYRKITFTSDIDHSWGIDLIIQANKANRVKRVFLAKHIPSGFSNPLESNIKDILEHEVRGGSLDTGYSTAFKAITSLLSVRANVAAQKYADTLYKSINFIVNNILRQDNIKNVNGRWYMSSMLWDVLNANKIIVGGIIIKPIVSITPQNQIAVSVLYDFSEELTVEFKGDRDYMQGVQYSSINK